MGLPLLFPKPRVLIFDRRSRTPPNPHPHPGYLHLSTITKGTQAHVILVRSLLTNTLYIRKQYHPSTSASGNEVAFRDIPSDIAPRLVSYRSSELISPIGTEGEHRIVPVVSGTSDVYLYQYCNGGDLDDFLEDMMISPSDSPSSTLNSKTAQRLLLWSITSQIVTIIAYIQSGHRHKHPVPENWTPIAHCDLLPVNFFLSWPLASKQAFPLPQLRLGDWSHAIRFPLTTPQFDSEWDEEELEEFMFVNEIMRKIAFVYPDDRTEEGPVQLWLRLFARGKKWKVENCHGMAGMGKRLSIARYIAERFMLIADARMGRLKSKMQEGDEWPMPRAVRGYKVYEKAEMGGGIGMGGVYMDEDRLPAIIRKGRT